MATPQLDRAAFVVLGEIRCDGAWESKESKFEWAPCAGTKQELADLVKSLDSVDCVPVAPEHSAALLGANLRYVAYSADGHAVVRERAIVVLRNVLTNPCEIACFASESACTALRRNPVITQVGPHRESHLPEFVWDPSQYNVALLIPLDLAFNRASRVLAGFIEGSAVAASPEDLDRAKQAALAISRSSALDTTSWPIALVAENAPLVPTDYTGSDDYAIVVDVVGERLRVLYNAKQIRSPADLVSCLSAAGNVAFDPTDVRTPMVDVHPLCTSGVYSDIIARMVRGAATEPALGALDAPVDSLGGISKMAAPWRLACLEHYLPTITNAASRAKDPNQYKTALGQLLSKRQVMCRSAFGVPGVDGGRRYNIGKDLGVVCRDAMHSLLVLGSAVRIGSSRKALQPESAKQLARARLHKLLGEECEAATGCQRYVLETARAYFGSAPGIFSEQNNEAVVNRAILWLAGRAAASFRKGIEQLLEAIGAVSKAIHRFQVLLEQALALTEESHRLPPPTLTSPEGRDAFTSMLQAILDGTGDAEDADQEARDRAESIETQFIDHGTVAHSNCEEFAVTDNSPNDDILQECRDTLSDALRALAHSSVSPGLGALARRIKAITGIREMHKTCERRLAALRPFSNPKVLESVLSHLMELVCKVRELTQSTDDPENTVMLWWTFIRRYRLGVAAVAANPADPRAHVLPLDAALVKMATQALGEVPEARAADGHSTFIQELVDAVEGCVSAEQSVLYGILGAHGAVLTSDIQGVRGVPWQAGLPGFIAPSIDSLMKANEGSKESTLAFLMGRKKLLARPAEEKGASQPIPKKQRSAPGPVAAAAASSPVELDVPDEYWQLLDVIDDAADLLAAGNQTHAGVRHHLGRAACATAMIAEYIEDTPRDELNRAFRDEVYRATSAFACAEDDAFAYTTHLELVTRLFSGKGTLGGDDIIFWDLDLVEPSCATRDKETKEPCIDVDCKRTFWTALGRKGKMSFGVGGLCPNPDKRRAAVLLAIRAMADAHLDNVEKWAADNKASVITDAMNVDGLTTYGKMRVAAAVRPLDDNPKRPYFKNKHDALKRRVAPKRPADGPPAESKSKVPRKVAVDARLKTDPLELVKKSIENKELVKIEGGRLEAASVRAEMPKEDRFGHADIAGYVRAAHMAMLEGKSAVAWANAIWARKAIESIHVAKDSANVVDCRTIARAVHFNVLMRTCLSLGRFFARGKAWFPVVPDGCPPKDCNAHILSVTRVTDYVEWLVGSKRTTVTVPMRTKWDSVLGYEIDYGLLLPAYEQEVKEATAKAEEKKAEKAKKKAGAANKDGAAGAPAAGAEPDGAPVKRGKGEPAWYEPYVGASTGRLDDGAYSCLGLLQTMRTTEPKGLPFDPSLVQDVTWSAVDSLPATEWELNDCVELSLGAQIKKPAKPRGPTGKPAQAPANPSVPVAEPAQEVAKPAQVSSKPPGSAGKLAQAPASPPVHVAKPAQKPAGSQVPAKPPAPAGKPAQELDGAKPAGQSNPVATPAQVDDDVIDLIDDED